MVLFVVALALQPVPHRPASWGKQERVQTKVLQCAALASVPACLTLGNPTVAATWQSIYAWPLAHTNMFEALTATAGFFVAIAFWSAAHLILWPSAERRERNARRFRYDRELPAAPFEWLGQLGWRRLLGAYLPAIAYLGSIALFHCFVTKPPLPAEPPTATRFFVELGLGVILYDLIFWPIHASFHADWAPKFWKRLHHTHHVARPSERRGKSLMPLETVQHSYADGFLQVATNVFVQRLGLYAGLPKHPLSRVAHNLLVTYMLAEAHSGYDLPWMTHRLCPWLVGGAIDHDKHHRFNAKHYHQFFRLPRLRAPKPTVDHSCDTSSK